jgi:hypothetical protein
MRPLLLGLILGSLFTNAILWAGSNLYNGEGALQAPKGSQQAFDYYRARQQYSDISDLRKATEAMAREAKRNPCGK